MPVYSCDKRIDCDTNLLTNYSSEGAEPYPPYYAVVYPPITDIPLDAEWSMPGCLYICTSYISQEDANLCALRQAILCEQGPPGQEIWYSAPATCTATCPDGTVFYFTVPAGMFIARTYAESLAQAQSYACLRAQEERFCLQDLPRCACAGLAYSGTITSDVGRTGLTWSVVGALPPGLTLTGTSTTATISGTPLLKGTYAFQLVATDANGNYAIKTFTIQVVEITTTSLPAFTIGTPYSYQLTADGGSGNYTWRIATGTLPDGLDLSSTGLISGTPTNMAIGGALTFEVADTTCEQLEASDIKPRVAMITSSTTRNLRWLGWQAFNGEPRRFKKLTWTGECEQWAYPFGSPTFEECCRAKYIWNGSSEITVTGVQISWYTKDLFTRAGDGRVQPYPYSILRAGGTENLGELIGYCWDADPKSSNDCDSTNLTPAGDVSTNSIYDTAITFSSGVENPVVTATTFSQTGTRTWDTLVGWILTPSGPNGNFQPQTPIAPQGFPQYVLNEELGPWIHLTTVANYAGLLSEEYTDAEALANAVTYTSNSPVAENRPRNFSSTTIEDWFRAKVTDVTYSLNCTRLIVGRNYKVQVSLYRSDGHLTIASTIFTATSDTHVVVGTIPTPPANMYTIVKYPVIAFA